MIVDIISLLSSFASLILAVVAIWLSIVFFKLSSKLSESTTEAAKGIGASVERLEKLFDKLYADTFSMMRDTVSDMRKHMWPDETVENDHLAEEAEKKADAKIEELKKDISQELGTVFQRQRIADEKLDSIRSEMGHLIDRVITSSRQVEVEAREETLQSAILRSLRIMQHKRPRVTAAELVDRLSKDASPNRIVEELTKLRDDGLLLLSDERVAPDTTIQIRGVRRGRPDVDKDE